MIELTLDTSCFETNKKSNIILKELKKLEKEGRIKIYHEKLTGFECKKLKGPKKKAIIRIVEKTSNITKNITGFLPSDVSIDKVIQDISNRRGFSEEDFKKVFFELINIVYPEGLHGKNLKKRVNKKIDLKILAYHILRKRDFFVTKEKTIFRKSKNTPSSTPFGDGGIPH